MWVPCDQKAVFRTKLVKKLTLVSLLVKKLTLVSLLVLACVSFASYTSPEEKSEKRTSLWIQLFRERLSSKVHATIPQSIVDGFEFTACSPKKFQRRAGKGMDERLQVLTKSVKSRFDSYSVRNSVLIISHITFRDCHVHTFFRQPFSK